MQADRVLIVGGGQAGAQAAFSLRQWGFAGAIAIIGDEPSLPYERPPLSKDLLKGTVAEDALLLKPPSWYAEHDVALYTPLRATRIDRERRVVATDAGEEFPYDALVLATGSRPRRLAIPGAGLEGILELRTLADARAIAKAARPGSRLAVVGAGYIGLEVASACRSLGVDVVVLEAMDRVLARVAGEVVSRFFEREHRERGVELQLGARLEAFEGNGRVEALRLAGGGRIDADAVVAGIGIAPCQELAEASGIACRDGIVVDRDARTSDPRIFAAGDCARRPLVHYGRDGRLESVHNAIEQGKLAAAAILGRARPAEEVPWFWSDQYDLKLQIAGLGEGHDEVVVRGDPAERRFAAFYLKQGRLIGVDAIASPMEFMASRQLIARDARPDPHQLADPAVSMKAIVDATKA